MNEDTKNWEVEFLRKMPDYIKAHWGVNEETLIFDFIRSNFIPKEEVRKAIRKMKKYKTDKRELYTFGGKTEVIDYWQSEGDPYYNKALTDLSKALLGEEKI